MKTIQLIFLLITFFEAKVNAQSVNIALNSNYCQSNYALKVVVQDYAGNKLSYSTVQIDLHNDTVYVGIANSNETVCLPIKNANHLQDVEIKVVSVGYYIYNLYFKSVSLLNSEIQILLVPLHSNKK